MLQFFYTGSYLILFLLIIVCAIEHTIQIPTHTDIEITNKKGENTSKNVITIIIYFYLGCFNDIRIE